MQGVDLTLRSMEEDPDTFFLVAPVDEDFFSKVDIVFKSKDALTKKTFMFSLSGIELLNWLPKHYFVDFKTKFRRNKFGSYLAQYLAMKFVSKDGIELHLLKEVNRAADGNVQDEVEELVPEAAGTASKADERSLASDLPPEDPLSGSSSVKSEVKVTDLPQQFDPPAEVLESELVEVDVPQQNNTTEALQ